MRWIFALHRYIGIGVGFLMLMWCLSGIVMMYVPYPSLDEAMRLKGLKALDWNGCCAVPVDAGSPFSVEMADGKLLLFQGQGAPLDLKTGTPASFDEEALSRIADNYAAGNRIVAGSRSYAVLDYDQWTVQSRRAGPFYRVDADGTYIYLSNTSGKVVQSVTASQRFWSYLGGVPHWLYFAELRAQAVWWTQIVIWTSVLGSFLTLTGLFIGIRQLLRARVAGRWSPYRGFAWWHHLPGLVFGIFLLSWVVSGLLSMNPWGLLEGGGGDGRFEKLAGTVSQGPLALPNTANGVRLESSFLDGKVYWIVTHADGLRERLDADGAPAPLKAEDIAFITRTLSGGEAGTLLLTGDDYYFSHGSDTARFPVWRFIDETGTRYYVDPVSGEVTGLLDAGSKGYRWFFQGLHRFDFTDAFRARPLRDIFMLLLLAGASLVSATGVWMGVRYLRRSRPEIL